MNNWIAFFAAFEKGLGNTLKWLLIILVAVIVIRGILCFIP